MHQRVKKIKKEVVMSKKKNFKRESPKYSGQDYYKEPVTNIPEGCAACGGPYPDCKWSCPMFDDD